MAGVSEDCVASIIHFKRRELIRHVDRGRNFNAGEVVETAIWFCVPADAVERSPLRIRDTVRLPIKLLPLLYALEWPQVVPRL